MIMLITKYDPTYFPINLSRLNLPGPVKSIAKNASKNNPGSSPLPKKFPLFE